MPHLLKRDERRQDLRSSSHISSRGKVVRHIYPKHYYLSKYDLADGSVIILIRLHIIKVEDSLYALCVRHVYLSFCTW